MRDELIESREVDRLVHEHIFCRRDEIIEERYSTAICVAWKIVERLWPPFTFEIVQLEDGTWTCLLLKDGIIRGGASSSSAPDAIARAALKTLGVDLLREGAE
jgi:hypothetical protein